MYQELIRPILDQVGHSEEMHSFVRDSLLQNIQEIPGVLTALRHVIGIRERFTHPNLAVTFNGIDLENPTILAAGWDKNGTAVAAEHALGFGAIVVGGVLKNPQEGNPKPRQWASGPHSVNFIGLWSQGVDVVEQNLIRYQESNIPIIANIANNHDVTPQAAPQAFAEVAKRLSPYVRAFEICICPNRDETLPFMEYAVARDIGQAVKEQVGVKAVYLKTLPDMNTAQLLDFIKAVEDGGLQGFVASNTTKRTDIKNSYQFSKGRPGGYSGPDQRYRASVLSQIAFLRRESDRNITILGVGGIQTGFDAILAIGAGANAIEGNTGMRAQGLAYPDKLNRSLARIVGPGSRVSDYVGIDRTCYPNPPRPE